MANEALLFDYPLPIVRREGLIGYLFGGNFTPLPDGTDLMGNDILPYGYTIEGGKLIFTNSRTSVEDWMDDMLGKDGIESYIIKS